MTPTWQNFSITAEVMVMKMKKVWAFMQHYGFWQFYKSTARIIIIIIITIIIPWGYSLLRVSFCEPTTDLTSTYPQTGVKDHLTSLGVMYDQQIRSPSCYWLSRPGLSLQKSSSHIPHDARLTLIPYTVRKSSSAEDWTNTASCSSSLIPCDQHDLQL